MKRINLLLAAILFLLVFGNNIYSETVECKYDQLSYGVSVYRSGPSDAPSKINSRIFSIYCNGKSYDHFFNKSVVDLIPQLYIGMVSSAKFGKKNLRISYEDDDETPGEHNITALNIVE